jgi:cholesterol transport system auxiliary component
LLLAPEAEPMYDSTRIAYIDMPHRLAYFSRHEWAATPSQMLQPLLLRMLERARYFSALVTPPYAGPYAYALRTQMQELVQDFTSDPPVVRLALHVQLNDGVSNRLLGAREIAVRKPMRDRTPLAGVEAANLALADALRRTAAFLLEATR